MGPLESRWLVCFTHKSVQHKLNYRLELQLTRKVRVWGSDRASGPRGTQKVNNITRHLSVKRHSSARLKLHFSCSAHTEQSGPRGHGG